MKLHLYLYMILAALMVAGPVSVSAGGSAEDSAGPEEQDRESSAETTSSIDVEEMETHMRSLLEDVGVRTFDERISAVDFGLPSLTDDERRLSDYSGQFVFLNFWATWCPPCREEMPSMEVMHHELADLPFRVVAIDVQEGRDTVAAFVDEMDYSFEILLDESGRVAANYGVRGIPTTYFISPAGTVLGMLVGTRYWDEPDILETMQKIAEIAERAEAAGS
ncbi:MAG: TlpA disulfide reductase family protein [Alkalispirochaeta sp.]